MGLDYIRMVAGNFKKAWSKGGQALAAPDLYTLNPQCTTRSFLGDLSDGVSVKVREKLVLQCDGTTLVAFRDNTRIATATNPPKDLVSAVQSCGGYALVEVETVHSAARAVNLLVKE